MPSPCFVPGCKGNYSSALKKVGSYSFPRDEMLKKKWLEVIHRKESNISKYSRVCEVHFKKSDFETEASAYDPKTGVVITCPLAHKRLKKGVIPSLLLPTCDSVSSNKKSSSKQKKQLKAESSNTIQSKLKWSPVKSSELKDSSQTTSPATRILGNKNDEEESREMVKRKRKSTTNEKIKVSSTKKLNSSSKLNGTHSSNNVQASEKSTTKSKADKPVCTNPEAFAYLNIQVKQEPLSDEETHSGPSRDNPGENISENVQITNVRSLSSERSIAGSPSAEVAAAKIQNTSSLEVNATRKSDEGLDSDFYSKPLDMDQRDKAFGSFVACELSDLRANPSLYMKTKQAILKLLTEAHFEQMSSCKNS